MSEPATIASGTEKTPSNAAAVVRLLVAGAAIIAIAAFFHGLDVLIVVAALVAHGDAARVRTLHHREGLRDEGDGVLLRLRTAAVVDSPRRDRVRREGDSGGGLCPDRRHDLARGGRAAKTSRAATGRRRSPAGSSVAVSGSAMQFIIAFVLLFVMIAFTGLPRSAPLEISGLTAYSNRSNPAQAAGVRPGDTLVAVDGHHYANVTRFISFIEDHPGDTVSLTVRRAGRLMTLPVHVIDGRTADLASDHDQPEKQGNRPVGVIGVDLGADQLVTTSVLDAIPRSGVMLGRVIQATGDGFAQVFSFHGLSTFVHEVATARNAPSSSSSTGGASSTQSTSSSRSGELLSLPGAVDIAAQALRNNVSELLYILVAINLFVGMANLFPMLPLDGGHVAIAIYERIRSRRNRAVSRRRQEADARRLCLPRRADPARAVRAVREHRPTTVVAALRRDSTPPLRGRCPLRP